jgi:uncharacterized SAM-binding protein YcdF (DUF218 family)
MEPDLALRAVCRALVLPPGGPVLLACAGLVVWRHAPRLGRALVAAGLALIVLLSVPVLADLLNQQVERYPPIDLAQPPSADLIVVLGGGTRLAAGAPDRLELAGASLERLAYGAALARRTGLPLLLSGGSVGGEQPEAEVMQRTLAAAFGLEARWLETRSRTTHENARYSAALLAPLGAPRVLLVTSAVHMPRAMAEFRNAGVRVVAAPVPGARPTARGLGAWLPRPMALERSWEALYELAGQIVQWLGGNR